MIVLWTSQDAADATGGKLQGNPRWHAMGISIDSRTVKAGDLFVALKGDVHDGHDHVAQAFEKGACAAMVSGVPANLPENAALLVVDDTLQALRLMGLRARQNSNAVAIGVTGSVGKTGTKEMLAAAFGVNGITHASKASYNNHIGVPLTLALLPQQAMYGVFEMGMNHAGEIDHLTHQVHPDIAIITTIAAVHIEHFGTLEKIAKAKAEIFNGMDADGQAILPRDNEFFGLLEKTAMEAGVGTVWSFGEHEDSDARLENVILAANGTRATGTILGEKVAFTLPIAGKHIALNAFSVLLAVRLAGGDVQKAAKALEKIEPVKGRGNRDLLDIGDAKNPVILIDESYNASPVAMNAAFRVLAMIDPGRGGRRIAVLGDMYEQGARASEIHAELAIPLQAAGIQLVYTSGPLMKNLYDALPDHIKGAHKDDSADLAKIVPEALVPGDVVLVKGSRGGGLKPRMQVVVEALRELPEKLKNTKKNNAV